MKKNNHPYRIIVKSRRWMLPLIYGALFALVSSLAAIAAIEKDWFGENIVNETGISLIKALAGFSLSALSAIALIIGIEAKYFVGALTEYGRIEPTYLSKNSIQFYLCIVLIALVSLGFFAIGVHWLNVLTPNF